MGGIISKKRLGFNYIFKTAYYKVIWKLLKIIFNITNISLSNNTIYNRYVFILITLIYSTTVYPQHILTGEIINENQKGISYSTLQVLSQDSTFIQGTITDSLGCFRIENISKGNYLFRVSAMGYIPKVTHWTIHSDQTLPPIIMKTDNIFLREITVIGSSMIQQKDRLLVIPDKLQTKHAYTGYDLLYNLMIPGISVDRREGKVSTSRGSATLYINGVKADFREVQNIRPKDIEKVEYFSMPTGDYIGDVASINYITKEYKAGAYITLDGEQNIGYLDGKYNVATKITHNNTNYSFFGGYNMKKYDGVKVENNDILNLTNYTIYRNRFNSKSDYNNNQQYVQFKVNNNTTKRTLSGVISLVRDEVPNDNKSEFINYTRYPIQNTQVSENIYQKSLKPAIGLYGAFNPTEKQRIRLIFNGSHTQTSYIRDYMEDKQKSMTSVDEKLYNFSAIGIYNIKLKYNNSLGWNIQHHQDITSSSYSGDYNSWQHLSMGESMSFLSYTQDLGKFSFTISPGISLLQYKLRNNNKQYFWTFRTQSWGNYNINSKHQLTAGLSIGNYHPSINTINTVDQNVDFLIIKRGNPNLKNTKIHEYFLTYNAYANSLNIQFNSTYTILTDNIVSDYYIENDKIINSYHSNSSFQKFKSELLCSYRISDNLRANATLKYEHMNVPGASNLKENNYFASTYFNYFIKHFAINIYAKTTENKLDKTTLAFLKYPASYGLSVRYSRNNWMAEMGTENPFTKELHYRENADYGVYKYNQTRISRIYQQTAYIKLAYTFDFGKKTSRDSNDVDRSINSAILKAR